MIDIPFSPLEVIQIAKILKGHNKMAALTEWSMILNI